MKGKTIAGIVMLLVAATFMYLGYNIELNTWLVAALGGGIGFLVGGPFGALIGALGGAVVASFILKIAGIILAAWTAILAAWLFAASEEKAGWIIFFWIVSTVFLIDLAFFDPIPIIDELFLGMASVFAGMKSINPDSSPAKLEAF